MCPYLGVTGVPQDVAEYPGLGSPAQPIGVQHGQRLLGMVRALLFNPSWHFFC